MKKLISLILVLALACMMVPAMADEDVTGEWYGSFAGVPMTMTLNADGTLTMTSPGQEGAAEGTWTLEGDQLTLNVSDSPATATVTAEGIKMADGGLEIIFTREPVEAIKVAEVKANAAEEEFYGEWILTYMESTGVVLDPSSVGMVFPNMKLTAEGTVEFVAASEEDFFASILNMMAMTSSYEDGVLKLKSTMEGSDATGKCEMLEDGMLKLSLDNDSDLMVLYYSPAAAAEQPAA